MPNIVTLRWPEAGEFVAAMGPAAVTICLDLAHEASVIRGGLTVVTTLRDLAARVGLSKDTVHRHLRQLENAGVIERVCSLDQFSATTYLLHLDTTGIHQRPQAQSPRASRTAKPAGEAPEQPSLPFSD